MAGYCCWKHEINFATKQKYRHHSKIECRDMLSKKNTCTFQLEDGQCCRQHFQHTASLVIHSLIVHKIQVCDRCYYSCPAGDTALFEAHRHRAKTDLRNSVYFCILYNEKNNNNTYNIIHTHRSI